MDLPLSPFEASELARALEQLVAADREGDYLDELARLSGYERDQPRRALEGMVTPRQQLRAARRAHRTR